MSWWQRLRRRVSLLRIRRGGLRPVSVPVAIDRLGDYAALQSARGALGELQNRQPRYPPARALSSRGYRGNSVARRCIDLICESATLARPRVLETSSSQPAAGPLAESILRLLAYPMATEDSAGARLGDELLWRTYQDLLNTGNAFWEAVPGFNSNAPAQLWRMDPTNVAILPDAETLVGGYLYNVSGTWYPVPPEAVIHWKLADPSDDYFGLPPLYSALRSLATDNDLVDYLATTIQNLGVPPVVLEYDLGQLVKAEQPLVPSNEQLDEISARFAAKYSGKNRGRAGVAWGFKVRPVGLDMQQLAIGDLVATSEARVAMVFGVPTILLGRSGTQSDPTRANFQQAREHFLTTVIRSMVDRVARVLTARLLPMFPGSGGLRISLDLSKVDVLREAKIRRAKDAGSVFLAGLASRHTCQDLAGLPLSGPDVFYRPATVEMAIEADATTEPQLLETALPGGA